MKIRMQFAKYGRMLYIGHLDVMRYFQKALRRADVDLIFTQGYSPHPILSFAAPLGVGIESNAEYADLEVYATGPSNEMIDRLNRVMVNGMEVLDWRLLPDDAKNAMSSVAAADYALTFRPQRGPAFDSSPSAMHDYMDGLRTFLNQDEIIVEKKTKKGSRTIDIRPLIYDYSLDEKEGTIYLEVCTGSVNNLKPELVLTAYHEAYGLPWKEEDFHICRLETYTDISENEEQRKLIPLKDVGTCISKSLYEEMTNTSENAKVKEETANE